MAAPKIAIVAGRRNSSLFRSSAPVRIPQSACSCVVGGSGQESGMRPGGRIAVARTGRALPIARSLSSNTRSVLAGRCACTYSHSVPVTDVLASIPWYSSLAVHSGCCAPKAALPVNPRAGQSIGSARRKAGARRDDRTDPHRGNRYYVRYRLYRIEGSAFVYADDDGGRVTTILGYPTDQLGQVS